MAAAARDIDVFDDDEEEMSDNGVGDTRVDGRDDMDGLTIGNCMDGGGNAGVALDGKVSARDTITKSSFSFDNAASIAIDINKLVVVLLIQYKYKRNSMLPLTKVAT
jgi:hypothetical protein